MARKIKAPVPTPIAGTVVRVKGRRGTWRVEQTWASMIRLRCLRDTQLLLELAWPRGDGVLTVV